MKVTLLLRNDHEKLHLLMEKFEKTQVRKQERKTIFLEIRDALQMHSRMASEVFYSALAATPSDRAVALVATAEERCTAVEKLFQEINRMNPSEPNFDSRMKTVIEEIRRHIDMEEDELFHEARKSLSEYRLEELGLEMQQRRETLKMLVVA